ncbi:MAG: hypothetical protein U0V02_09635 [Anaerolineales bacterium]
MTTNEEWVTNWLKTVEAGLNTMSQRKLSSIEKHAGSLKTVTKIAKSMRVHLLLVEDDEGNEVVAASMKPFKVLC